MSCTTSSYHAPSTVVPSCTLPSPCYPPTPVYCSPTTPCCSESYECCSPISKLASFAHYGGRGRNLHPCPKPCPPPSCCRPKPRYCCPPPPVCRPKPLRPVQCCPPPPVVIQNCPPSHHNNNRPADRLYNVDILEELCYTTKEDCCKVDCYKVCDGCGNVEPIDCDPCCDPCNVDPCNPCATGPGSPVKYSRRQRFSFREPEKKHHHHCHYEDTHAEPLSCPPPWPFKDPCCKPDPCCADPCDKLLPSETGVYYYDKRCKRFTRQHEPSIPCMPRRMPPPQPQMMAEEICVEDEDDEEPQVIVQPLIQPMVMPQQCNPCNPCMQMCNPFMMGMGGMGGMMGCCNPCGGILPMCVPMCPQQPPPMMMMPPPRHKKKKRKSKKRRHRRSRIEETVIDFDTNTTYRTPTYTTTTSYRPSTGIENIVVPGMPESAIGSLPFTTEQTDLQIGSNLDVGDIAPTEIDEVAEVVIGEEDEVTVILEDGEHMTQSDLPPPEPRNRYGHKVRAGNRTHIPVNDF